VIHLSKRNVKRRRISIIEGQEAGPRAQVVLPLLAVVQTLRVGAIAHLTENTMERSNILKDLNMERSTIIKKVQPQLIKLKHIWVRK
jgi:hypothetical protein